MFCRFAAGVVALLVMLTGCSGSKPTNPVESLSGEDTSAFVLQSLKGTRDGETLRVQAMYATGAKSLRVDMQFRVTPPTRLQSGTWSGPAGEGTVSERSVTFLGGQSAAPSIGGKFDLIGPAGQALYRITIPLQELKQPL
jgi:hypothetical protein